MTKTVPMDDPRHDEAARDLHALVAKLEALGLRFSIELAEQKRGGWRYRITSPAPVRRTKEDP